MAVFKWALVLFGSLTLALVLVSKLLAFLNPPRPGRPEPLLLARTRRAIRWSVIVPALVGLLVLAATLWRGP